MSNPSSTPQNSEADPPLHDAVLVKIQHGVRVIPLGELSEEQKTEFYSLLDITGSGTGSNRRLDKATVWTLGRVRWGQQHLFDHQAGTRPNELLIFARAYARWKKEAENERQMWSTLVKLVFAASLALTTPTLFGLWILFHSLSVSKQGLARAQTLKHLPLTRGVQS